MKEEVEAARHKGRNGRWTEKNETKKNREQKTDNLRLDYTTMKKRVKCFIAVKTTYAFFRVMKDKAKELKEAMFAGFTKS